MNIKQSSFFLEFLLHFLQVLITCVIIYLYTHTPYNCYQIQWITVPVLIGALFFSSGSPFSKHHSGFVKILTFQSLLYMSFYGISALFGPHTFVKVVQETTWHLGFFPWGLMLTIAVGLRLLNHHSQQDTSIVDLITRVIPINKNNQCLPALHVFIRGATNFNIALTLALISISIYARITGPLDTFSIKNLLVSFIVIALLFSKPSTYLIKKTAQSRRWLYLTMPLYIVMITLLLSAIAIGLSPLSTLKIETPFLLTVFNHLSTASNTRLLFGTSWWLTWAAIGGVFIAHHSRMMTLKQMIVSSSIIPLLMGILLQPHQIDALLLPTNTWCIVFSIIGISGIIKLVTEENTLPCLILAYLPKTEHPKQRAHQFLFAKNLKTTLFILFFSIPMGLKMLNFFSCFISMPLEVFSMIITLGVGVMMLQST